MPKGGAIFHVKALLNRQLQCLHSDIGKIGFWGGFMFDDVWQSGCALTGACYGYVMHSFRQSFEDLRDTGEERRVWAKGERIGRLIGYRNERAERILAVEK